MRAVAVGSGRQAGRSRASAARQGHLDRPLFIKRSSGDLHEYHLPVFPLDGLSRDAEPFSEEGLVCGAEVFVERVKSVGLQVAKGAFQLFFDFVDPMEEISFTPAKEIIAGRSIRPISPEKRSLISMLPRC